MSIAELPPSVNHRCDRPERNPFLSRCSAVESQRAGLASLDDLCSLNFYCFGGRRDFSQGFRALVVGGESGQSAVDLAGQLQGTDAVVVCLEPDEQAMDAAQERARALRVCDGIEWIQASPLDLSRLGLEPFDYINGCGLLEQAGDASAALKQLKGSLKPDGALGLAFRGKYGRAGLSQMRQLMQFVNHDVRDPHEQVALTRAVIGRLPATNWCKRSADLFPLYDNPSDAEIYELFLDRQPAVYSLPEVWDALDSAGICLVEHTREQRALYEPRFAFPEGDLLAEIQKLSRRRQQAATELYWGAVTQHTFWASARLDTVASLLDPDMIPFFTRFAAARDIQQSILRLAGDEWSWTTRLAGEVDVSITFHVAPAARRFVELIDDRRTLAEIIETILSAYNPRPPVEEAWKIARYVMEVLLRQDLLLVRHKSTQPLAPADPSGQV